MSLRESILGLLMQEPMSGYEIKTFYRDTIRNFWNVSDGQLYPTLKKMHEEGIIRKRVVRQKDSPNKHLYSITPYGKRIFEEWIRKPVLKTQELKEPFALKVFFFDYLTKEDILRHLNTQFEHTSRILEESRELRKSYSTKVTAYQRLVGDVIPFFYELRLLWLTRVMELVSKDRVNKNNPLYTDEMLEMVRAFYSEVFLPKPSSEFRRWMNMVLKKNRNKNGRR